jgi:hypothetical protein
MERCSVARRLYHRADGIGQKHLITKGHQPETYGQNADDNGYASNAILLTFDI